MLYSFLECTLDRSLSMIASNFDEETFLVRVDVCERVVFVPMISSFNIITLMPRG